MYNFFREGHIQLIKSNGKDIYNVTNIEKYIFLINTILGTTIVFNIDKIKLTDKIYKLKLKLTDPSKFKFYPKLTDPTLTWFHRDSYIYIYIYI